MIRHTAMAAALFCCAAGVTHAAEPHLAVFYIPESDLGPDSDVEGDGFGARAELPFGANWAAHAEYQTADYDEAADLEITQIRAGLGSFYAGSMWRAGPVAEFIRAELDNEISSEELDGYGVHLRGEALFEKPTTRYFAQVGFVRLDDNLKLDGPEFSAGASVMASKYADIFIDVRHSNLSSEQGVQLELTDIRVGVRMSL